MNIFRRTLTKTSRSLAPAILSAGIALTICSTPPKLSAQTDLPANIDSGLHRLTTTKQTKSVAGAGQRAAKPSRFEKFVIRDAEQRVQVEIHLNGKEPIAAVRDQLTNLGANVI